MLPFLGEHTAFLPWPLTWLAFFPNQKVALSFLFAALVGSTASAIFFPWKRWVRLLNFILLFVMIPSYYLGTGRMYHEFYAWLITSFFLLPLREDYAEEKKKFCWNFAQAGLLFIYFISGTWKIRSALEGLSDGMTWKDFCESLGGNIAANVVAGGGLPRVGRWLMTAPDSLQLVLWLTAFLIEILVWVPLWKRRWMPLYGVLLILMHLGIFLAMDILYAPTVVAILVLLVAEPLHRRKIRA
jgi:hypothetical protein